jgi:hypothetical protein
MGRVFFCVAALFFFLSAVGANLIPKPEAWGLVLLAIGLAVGGVPLIPWRKVGP